MVAKGQKVVRVAIDPEVWKSARLEAMIGDLTVAEFVAVSITKEVERGRKARSRSDRRADSSRGGA